MFQKFLKILKKTKKQTQYAYKHRYQIKGRKKVLVTGDRGKLGSLVSDKFSKNYDVIGFDIAFNEAENLHNKQLLKQLMEDVHAVVHLAAIPHPNSGSFREYFRVNVEGSLNVIETAVEKKVKRFIYISSTAYYGCDIEGKLNIDFFPINETRTIAQTDGVSKGMLDSYNQSKVMAESICAYFGTNKLIEVLVLRSAPANINSIQYPEGFDWKECEDYRKGAFWANNDPQNVANAVYLAVKSDKKFTYEAFNLTNKHTDKKIDLRKFLKKEYPKAKVNLKLHDNPSLFDTSKIEKTLGFKAQDY